MIDRPDFHLLSLAMSTNGTLSRGQQETLVAYALQCETQATQMGNDAANFMREFDDLQAAVNSTPDFERGYDQGYTYGVEKRTVWIDHAKMLEAENQALREELDRYRKADVVAADRTEKAVQVWKTFCAYLLGEAALVVTDQMHDEPLVDHLMDVLDSVWHKLTDEQRAKLQTDVPARLAIALRNMHSKDA